MADFDLTQFCKDNGIPIEGDVTTNLKTALETLKAKAGAQGEMKTTLEALQTAMTGLAGTVDGMKEAQVELAAKVDTANTTLSADPDTGRRAQSAIMSAKTLPARAELDAFLRRAPQDDFEKSVHDFNDTLMILAQAKGMRVRDLKYFQDTIAKSPAFADTLMSDSDGDGLDWVPTSFSGQVWQDIRLQTLVASNLVNIDMPSPDFKLPYKTGHGTVYLTEQATNLTVSQFGTDVDTLSAKGIGCAMAFSGEMAEDSIIAVMPLIRIDLATSIAEAIEDVLINGDNTGTHMDKDIADAAIAADPRHGWKGYRKLCLAGSVKVDFGTFGVTCLRAARKMMKKFGLSPADLMWVPGVSGMNSFLGISECLTMDKYGANATLLTGEIGRFDGIPIVPSGQVREDIDANGVNAASGNTKTSTLLINKRWGVFGTRRRLTIEDDRFILGDYTLVVAKTRVGFIPRMGITTSMPSACIGYNQTA
jgi:HK97 family phage major capsid protein